MGGGRAQLFSVFLGIVHENSTRHIFALTLKTKQDIGGMWQFWGIYYTSRGAGKWLPRWFAMSQLKEQLNYLGLPWRQGDSHSVVILICIEIRSYSLSLQGWWYSEETCVSAQWLPGYLSCGSHHGASRDTGLSQWPGRLPLKGFLSTGGKAREADRHSTKDLRSSVVTHCLYDPGKSPNLSGLSFFGCKTRR
jgi:hypothetical protein